MSSRAISRRQFLTAGAALAGMSVLAACVAPIAPQTGGQEAGAAPAQETINLTFASQYPGPPLNAGDDQVIANFEAANPNITIEKMTWPGPGLP